jgi:hypothetical protein
VFLSLRLLLPLLPHLLLRRLPLVALVLVLVPAPSELESLSPPLFVSLQ